MTRTTLLKTATLSLLIGAMTLPSVASASAPQARGTEYNHRSVDNDDRREARDERRDDRREWRQDRRDDRRDDRREARRTGYKYGFGAFHAPFRAHTFRNGDFIGRQMTGNRYIINNPRAIDLPNAGRNKAYVRHYNDVLLVNLRSGKVIAVYRNHLRW